MADVYALENTDMPLIYDPVTMQPMSPAYYDPTYDVGISGSPGTTGTDVFGKQAPAASGNAPTPGSGSNPDLDYLFKLAQLGLAAYNVKNGNKGDVGRPGDTRPGTTNPPRSSADQASGKTFSTSSGWGWIVIPLLLIVALIFVFRMLKK